LVYEEQKALEAGADYSFQTRDPYLFYLYAQAMPGQTPETLEQRIYQELNQWEKTPPSEEEIERAKNQLEAGYIFAQDSIYYQALLLGKYQTLGNWKGVGEFLPGIRSVRQSDLLRVYQNYFKNKPRSVGLLIPTPSDSKDRDSVK
jgi:zinc protease